MLIGIVFLLSACIFMAFALSIMLNKTPKQKEKKTQLTQLTKAKPTKGDDLSIWPFEPMPIMTDSEVMFFNKLCEALPEYYIFSQVQLSRIIEPSETVGKDRSFWFNRICRQSVDYVLVAKDIQTTLLAIELDDWTHNHSKRQKQDQKKDKALTSAGIPIIRFHAEKVPSVEMLRYEVLQVLKIN